MININNIFCMPPYLTNDDQLTIQTYQELYYRLERVALSCVKWNNLPVGLDQMIIERYLFYFGNVVLFYDYVLDRYVALPISGEFAWDINGYPTLYEVVGFGGYRARIDFGNSVIIWNNFQLNPSAGMAGLLASRLTNALRTSDMHLEAQKIGKLISVPETKSRGVKSLVQRIKNFNLYTIGSPAMKDLAESTTVLDTELDYIVDKLDNHYAYLWHDALSYFGIESMPTKASGVSQYEMEAERSMAASSRQAIMDSRKEGIKKFNEMFNLNVEVEFMNEGGKVSGQLHNDFKNSDGVIKPDDTTSNI